MLYQSYFLCAWECISRVQKTLRLEIAKTLYCMHVKSLSGRCGGSWIEVFPTSSAHCALRSRHRTCFRKTWAVYRVLYFRTSPNAVKCLWRHKFPEYHGACGYWWACNRINLGKRELYRQSQGNSCITQDSDFEFSFPGQKKRFGPSSEEFDSRCSPTAKSQ